MNFLMLFDLLLRRGEHMRDGDAEMSKKVLIRRRGAEVYHGNSGACRSDGASAIGAPGWPDFAASTASMASVRMVSIAS